MKFRPGRSSCGRRVRPSGVCDDFGGCKTIALVSRDFIELTDRVDILAIDEDRVDAVFLIYKSFADNANWPISLPESQTKF